ncbi:uncharacterized protein BO87DRAFT_65661 [Aspergillus neoniger CBS 115656]|uniref:Uncharacterized protein n=1 Tax=Aspergillus neoniger (strain CBS 115656) TaxID=1448310 RepID=A0A318YH14_ASPNB|nr:hypothetical protein BO87DRAFT_65661 [Aspergillus neoniger CBS 115656]PYH33755.1 hypothetical protein BO87DRAFT_65661 [Aspergillus neoniger CBS 115656]
MRSPVISLTSSFGRRYKPAASRCQRKWAGCCGIPVPNLSEEVWNNRYRPSQYERKVPRKSSSLAAGCCHRLAEILLRCLMLGIMLAVYQHRTYSGNGLLLLHMKMNG